MKEIPTVDGFEINFIVAESRRMNKVLRELSRVAVLYHRNDCDACGFFILEEVREAE